MTNRKIGVVGLGVGYALACCLAEAGYETFGIDVNPRVIANPRIDKSVSLFLKKRNRKITGNLHLSTDYGKLRVCDIVIVCVSTGDEKKLVLGHLEDAVKSCCSVMKTDSLLIIYSTLPFGSSKRIKKILELKGRSDLGIVIAPLMIAQGTTTFDFVNPTFVAFGSYRKELGEQARTFYVEFYRRSSLWSGKLPPMFVTTPETAELAKLTANAFLSTKISFANMTDELCKHLNVDSVELLKIVGSDWRIGSKMFKPGYAFGGACFPRDAQSLLETYMENSLDGTLIKATLEVNRRRMLEPLRVLETKKVNGKVLILGLCYKSGLGICTGSMSISLAEEMKKHGYDVVRCDPHFCQQNCPNDAFDAVVVATDEPCFKKVVSRICSNPETILFDYRMK